MAKIRTTFEMDGLFTQQDIDNRFFIMAQCQECPVWSKIDTRVGVFKCDGCGGQKYNRRESRSIRTWLVTKDLKRVRQTKKNS